MSPDRPPALLPRVLGHVHLFATPIDVSPSGSYVYGISQARILE